MRLVIISLACILTCFQSTFGEERAPTYDLNQLSKQPGVNVSVEKFGTTTRTTWTKNGVSIGRTGEGSHATVVGNDNSGKGAVICSWMIFVWARSSLDLCPGPYEELKQDVDQSISMIDAFIVANSLEPTTLDEMRVRQQKADMEDRRKAQADPARLQKLCSTEGVAGQVIFYLKEMGHEKQRKMVEDLLSVPRWPVLNPCL